MKITRRVMAIILTVVFCFGMMACSKKGTNNTSSEVESSAEDVLTCRISIECGTILNNMDSLDKAKHEFVPEDGIIIKDAAVKFTKGETVFDIMKRVCAENKIQIASSYTPGYGAYHIDGINQLYDGDCGKYSGWMFKVNNEYPSYESSEVEVNDGDFIEWKFSCDAGADIDGGSH